MKPPVDWSPCQQKGEEHEWFVWNRTETSMHPNTWEPKTYVCTKCGVLVAALAFKDA